MFPFPIVVAATGSGTNYQLSGGTRAFLAADPAEANVIWSVSGNASGNGANVGYVQNDGFNSGEAVALGQDSAFATPPTGWGTLYVRLTAITNTADSSSHAIDGTTWHTLTEGVTNINWRETNDVSTPETCTVKVEIATDSGGARIVATGNYTSIVSAEL